MKTLAFLGMLMVVLSTANAWSSKKICTKKVKLGGRCDASDTVCVKGLVCDTDGICKAPRTRGENCREPNTVCVDGWSCHPDGYCSGSCIGNCGDEVFTDGLTSCYCDDLCVGYGDCCGNYLEICEGKLRGQECIEEAMFCSDGLVCDLDGVCRTRIEANVSCDMGCGHGLVCDFTERQCKTPLKAGENCSVENATCSEGLFCNDSFCDCSLNLNGDAGYFTSPGYPGEYDNDHDCTYTIQLSYDRPQTVQVTIEYNIDYADFKGRCRSDYLQLNSDGQLYCGSGTVTKTFGVTGREWSATFHTDRSGTRERGFILYYHVV